MTEPRALQTRTSPAWMRTRAWPLLRGIRREDAWLAAGYFAVFWLLNAVRFGGSTDLNTPWAGQYWALFAAVGCTAVLFRRTATAAMAVVCGLSALMLFLGDQPTSLVLVFELFFSLVLFGSPKVSAASSRCAFGLSLLLTLGVLAWTRAAEPTIVAASFAVMTMLMPVEWAGNLRKANQLAGSEAARADAVHDAAAQRLLAERSAHDLALEQERQHLARELHDVISARLSAIALQSGAALHAADSTGAGSGGPAAPGTALLRQIRQESVAGLEELNAMIRLLHTGALAEAPGHLDDLAGLVARYRSTGAEIALEDSLHDGGTRLPPAAQTAVYRIAAEALANAARHAAGQPVDIALTPAAGAGAGSSAPGLVLTVSNPLPPERGAVVAAAPPCPPGGTGTGLPSMHFRAAHAGGTVTAGPSGGRWAVVLQLPASAGDATFAAPGTTMNGHQR